MHKSLRSVPSILWYCVPVIPALKRERRQEEQMFKVILGSIVNLRFEKPEIAEGWAWCDVAWCGMVWRGVT